MKFKKIVIIGTGLIGGSIGKALLKKGLAAEVAGVCRRQSSLDKAVKEKAFSTGFLDNYDEAVKGADIIFIATPVHSIKEILKKLSETIEDNKVLVTDAGSTKKEIVEYASQFKDKFTFIGGHPLAGSEKSGVEYSSAELFEKSVCILTPSDDIDSESINILKDLWEKLGAAVVTLSPEKHDENLAFSSHLPHIAAYALVGVLRKDFPRAMLAAGFKDTTRIASSDQGLWSDIFLSNRENILKAIDLYKKVLSEMEEVIRKNMEKDLCDKLGEYKRVRDTIV